MEKSNLNVKGRQEAFKKFSEEQAEILIGKGHDYTAGQADVDAYANFRLIAKLLEGVQITPYTVAMIYGLKHIFSLITFAKTGKQESGEGLRGRHLDVANYSFILDQLVPDHLEHFCCGNPMEDCPTFDLVEDTAFQSVHDFVVEKKDK